MDYRVEIYKARKRFRQQWRWRAVADNGRIIAVAGESYTNIGDVESILVELFGENGDVPVSVIG